MATTETKKKPASKAKKPASRKAASNVTSIRGKAARGTVAKKQGRKAA